jgi:hypothetical protein
MDFDPAQVRSLPFDCRMGAEKDDDVEGDDPESDYGPTAPLHILVAKGNQHLGISIQEARRVLSDGFASSSLRGVARLTRAICRAIRESVTDDGLDTDGRKRMVSLPARERLSTEKARRKPGLVSRGSILQLYA